MKIEATFSTEIPEIEEDYPDQTAEYKVQVLQRELVSFVRHVADANTASEAECNAVEFQVAMSILESFQGRCNSNVLRERLESRFSGLKTAPSAEKPQFGTGWIIGNNFRERAIPQGQGEPDGEPWYQTADGRGWSAYDVAFRPDRPEAKND